jgi:hypothetical protein
MPFDDDEDFGFLGLRLRLLRKNMFERRVFVVM